MFTVYPGPTDVVIVTLDKHTSSSVPTEILADIYPDLSATGRRRSEQPPCCEEPSDPPAVSDDLGEVLEDLFGIF